MHRTTRRITEAVACLALGSAFSLGCVYAATPWDAVPNQQSLERAAITATYPSHGEPGPDGSITDPGALAAALDLPGCAGEDREPVLPCHVVTTPTYVVGGDNVRHDGCYVVLVNDTDSEMVCRDDTVWQS